MPQSLTFQSTPPCGGDYSDGVGLTLWMYFNPRPLAGATLPISGTCQFHPISIHAPLRGRQQVFNTTIPNMQFQSTPPCGGDKIAIAVPALIFYFNPRPLAGATKPFPVLFTTSLISIHAPLRGRLFTKPCTPSRLFQSTPPCGGDQCPAQ